MKRRTCIAAMALCTCAPLLAQDEAARPRHRISAAQLHQALAARFPVRLSAAGLLELHVAAPALLLLPGTQQLGATLQAQLSGPHLRGVFTGEADLVFALRYERSDRTIRAYRLRVRALRLPGMPRETVQTAQAVLATIAEDAMGEIVLHRFAPHELALADTMGFEPERISVVDDGLVIWFGPK